MDVLDRFDEMRLTQDEVRRFGFLDFDSFEVHTEFLPEVGT